MASDNIIFVSTKDDIAREPPQVNHLAHNHQTTEGALTAMRFVSTTNSDHVILAPDTRVPRATGDGDLLFSQDGGRNYRELRLSVGSDSVDLNDYVVTVIDPRTGSATRLARHFAIIMFASEPYFRRR